jgi:hypothetical protein
VWNLARGPERARFPKSQFTCTSVT